MRELIYKDEAYKAIDNCIRDGWDRISPSEAKMNIHQLVSDVNEADRPQGEWISKCNGKVCVCKNCGEEYDHTYEWIEKWKFCPNCGSRMKGVNNEHLI